MYYEPHKSSIANLDANLVALFVYLIPMLVGFAFHASALAWIIPLVVFFVEKDSDLVKFHCVQAVMLVFIPGVLSFIISMITAIIGGTAVVTGWFVSFSGIMSLLTGSVFGIILLVFGLITGIIALVFFVFKVIAMIKAYNYIAYEVPVIGKIASIIVNGSH